MAATELVRRGGTENRWLPLECGTARKIGGWEADRPPKPWTCLQRAQQAPFCRVIFASLAVFKEHLGRRLTVPTCCPVSELELGPQGQAHSVV